MALSFLFHMVTIINMYVACLSLKIHVAVLDLAAVIPIILAISMIPISLNSIGVWEGSFVYFFTSIGISAHGALSIALVIRAKNLFFALLGGIVFAARKGPPNRALTGDDLLNKAAV
jgi:uncharacterized membrane protein YbhN (UPF0104 family)